MIAESFAPTKLRLWTKAENYAGESWLDWYVFLGRHRDSDMLTESNFAYALRVLGESYTVRVVRESHWAVGWVEWIAIHKSDEKALRSADAMAAMIEDYPILDEDDLSNRECDAAYDYWNGWMTEPDLRHRIRTIAEWNARHPGKAWESRRVPILAARHDLHKLSERYEDFEQWIWELARE